MSDFTFPLPLAKQWDIGAGGFSIVSRRQVVLGNPTIYAVKQPDADDESQNQFNHEVDVWKFLRSHMHKNVIKCFGCTEVTTEDPLGCLVFELMDVTLGEMIDSPHDQMTEGAIKFISKEILQGLEHIHGLGVCHRDVKADNIFLDQRREKVKLAGFNVSSVETDWTRTQVGTPGFMAPELFIDSQSQCKGPEKDIYSFGVLFMEMACDGLRVNMGILIKKAGGKLSSKKLGEKMNKFVDRMAKATLAIHGAQSQELLSACLRNEPCERPTASALMEYKYFSVSDEEPVYSDDDLDPSSESHRSHSPFVTKTVIARTATKVQDHKSTVESGSLEPMFSNTGDVEALTEKSESSSSSLKSHSQLVTRTLSFSEEGPVCDDDDIFPPSPTVTRTVTQKASVIELQTDWDSEHFEYTRRSQKKWRAPKSNNKYKLKQLHENLRAKYIEEIHKKKKFQANYKLSRIYVNDDPLGVLCSGALTFNCHSIVFLKAYRGPGKGGGVFSEMLYGSAIISLLKLELLLDLKPMKKKEVDSFLNEKILGLLHDICNKVVIKEITQTNLFKSQKSLENITSAYHKRSKKGGSDIQFHNYTTDEIKQQQIFAGQIMNTVHLEALLSNLCDEIASDKKENVASEINALLTCAAESKILAEVFRTPISQTGTVPRPVQNAIRNMKRSFITCADCFQDSGCGIYSCDKLEKILTSSFDGMENITNGKSLVPTKSSKFAVFKTSLSDNAEWANAAKFCDAMANMVPQAVLNVLRDSQDFEMKMGIVHKESVLYLYAEVATGDSEGYKGMIDLPASEKVKCINNLWEESSILASVFNVHFSGCRLETILCKKTSTGSVLQDMPGGMDFWDQNEKGSSKMPEYEHAQGVLGLAILLVETIWGKPLDKMVLVEEVPEDVIEFFGTNIPYMKDKFASNEREWYRLLIFSFSHASAAIIRCGYGKDHGLTCPKFLEDVNKYSLLLAKEMEPLRKSLKDNEIDPAFVAACLVQDPLLRPPIGLKLHAPDLIVEFSWKKFLFETCKGNAWVGQEEDTVCDIR